MHCMGRQKHVLVFSVTISPGMLEEMDDSVYVYQSSIFRMH